jgi:hypothetical protein
MALDDNIFVLPNFILEQNTKDGCRQDQLQTIPISQKEFPKQGMDFTFPQKNNQNAK